MSDIRLLEPHEVPLLLPQAREFFKEGRIQGTLNEKHFVATLSSLVQADTGVVFVSGFPFRGAIGGVMFTDLATADRCCAEYFWYVATEERGSLGVRLLDAFEKESKKRGAIRMLMMHHTDYKAEVFEKLYEKRGYRLREQVFVKDLS